MTTLCLCDLAGYDELELEAKLRAEFAALKGEPEAVIPPVIPHVAELGSRRMEAPAWTR